MPGAGDRSNPLEPTVTWTVAAPQPVAGGYATRVAIEVTNADAAENLAVLVKAAVPLQEFHLLESGPEPVERFSPRKLRDGRELIVTSGTVAGRYEATVVVTEPLPIEVEAVLDVPFWGS
jgi:hypothetical protein